MVSLTLLFLFMTAVVILATSSSNNNSNKKYTSAAQAFSTIVQTRLQQSKQNARAKQQALIKLFEKSSKLKGAGEWWEDLSPSPFRLLLEEEEDALFFSDDPEGAAAMLGNEDENERIISVTPLRH